MNARLIGAIHVDEVIRILIFILIFLIPVIGKILTSMRAPQRPAGPDHRPPAQPPPHNRSLKCKSQRPKSVKDEIDEFLRRAAQKRQAPSVTPARRISPNMAPLAKAGRTHAGRECAGKTRRRRGRANT